MAYSDKDQQREYDREYAKKRRDIIKSKGYKTYSIILHPFFERKLDKLRGNMSRTKYLTKIIENELSQDE